VAPDKVIRSLPRWAKLNRRSGPIQSTEIKSRSLNKTSPICTWNHFPPQSETLDKAHGRLEIRRIWTRTELQGYLDFPYAAQVFAVERNRTQLTTGPFRTETAYGVTRLSREKASPARLLTLNRNHWEIENRLHWIRDWTFDEDRCRIRRGAGAHVMASRRNLALSLLRLAGAASPTEALRFCGRSDLRPLRMIGLAVT
jgi:hypothetical protein